MSQITYWSRFHHFFPYRQIRADQFELIEKILSAPSGAKIILEASTGVGKSIAALSTAMTRLEKGQQILIFTRTINQMEPFMREWSKLILNTQINFKDMVLLPVVGKSRLCRVKELYEETYEKSYPAHELCRSLPEDIEIRLSPVSRSINAKKDTPCPFYPLGRQRSKLKKINREANLAYSIEGFLPSHDYTIHNLRRYIERTGQCAYYGLRSILHHARILVLPHHYLDLKNYPKIANKLGFEMSNSLVIIDEAHHLLEYNILKITETQLETALDLVGGIPWLKNFDSQVKKLSGRIPRSVLFPAGLESHARFVHILKVLREMQDLPKLSKKDLYHPVLTTLEELIKNRFHGVFDKKLDTLRLIEFSPVSRLSLLKGSQLVIFQSATFHQVNIIKKAFQLPEAITHSTTLDRSTQEFRAMFHGVLTSKYDRRGPRLYNKMAIAISKLHQSQNGHTLVFFPSYEFLDEISQILQELYPDVSIIIEEATTSESVLNQKILQSRNAIILGNAIGKLAEGNEWVIDGKSLIKLVIIAGLPYISIDPEDQHWLELYRRKDFRTGKLPISPDMFTQLVPVLIRIEQCFGRAIRSKKDKAALVVLDFRCTKFRKHLRLHYYRNFRKLQDSVADFLA